MTKELLSIKHNDIVNRIQWIVYNNGLSVRYSYKAQKSCMTITCFPNLRKKLNNQLQTNFTPEMPANLRDLPVEILGQILGHVPEMIAPIRLVERALADAAWTAFIDHYIRTARIAVDPMDTSMRFLGHFVEQNGIDFTLDIQELSIHSHFFSLVGDQDAIDDGEAMANSVNRISKDLRRLLPALRNCRRVTFSPEAPVGPDGFTPNFFGMNPMLEHLTNVMQVDTGVISQPMQHRLRRLLIWGVLFAMARSRIAIEVVDPQAEQLMLQDVYQVLRCTPCRLLTSPGVTTLTLDVYDATNLSYRTNVLGQRNLNANNYPLPATAVGQNVHECQALLSNLNAWEQSHVDIDRTMVQCMLRHYPNLKKLDLALGRDWIEEEPPLFDVIPSHLPRTLHELTIRTWAGNGYDFAKTLFRLPDLKKLVLDRMVYKDAKAFQVIMRACQAHRSLASVQIISGNIGYFDEEFSDMCLGTCNGEWHRRTPFAREEFDVITPFMGMRGTLAEWERGCHAIIEEDWTDAFALMFGLNYPTYW